MPEMVGYRCENCGHGFVKEILKPEEAQQMRREPVLFEGIERR
jgi:hypothetical protein